MIRSAVRSSRVRLAVLLGLLSCGSHAAIAETTNVLAALSESRDTILSEQIREHAEVLADDTMEGREAGTAGGRSAATYIMRCLKQAGLKPAGDRGTFFQHFHAGCRNILAEIPSHASRLTSQQASSDKPQDLANASLAQEAIIVCAHYDHVGYGTRKTSNGPTGYIHNGADDNASGVATLLEVAEALQQYRGPLKRRVQFVFWDAEEKGLWGSKHWLKHPTIPLAKTKLLINVDMVGRLRGKLSLFGTRSLPGLRYEWTKANLGNALKMEFPWETLDNSDHYPFLKRGIPITMVHTGLHDEYHTPSDDAYLLNYEGIHSTAELILNFVVQAANRDNFDGFRWQSINEMETHQKSYERPYVTQKRKLGITLTVSANGMRIDSVVVGSIADQFGLRPGNVILAVNDKAAKSFKEFRQLVATAHESVDILVADRTGQRTVTITFDEPKPRVGISWRTNNAEPNTLTISSVSPQSLAEKAGLRSLDRIHKLNGRVIDDQKRFRSSLMTLTGPVELLIERDGQLQMVNFEIPAN